MRDQEPAPSETWSGSPYWTQVSEPVLLQASPACPCIPGPAKRRLGLKELGQDFGARVHRFSTISTRFSTHDALAKKFMDLNDKTMGKEDLGLEEVPWS